MIADILYSATSIELFTLIAIVLLGSSLALTLVVTKTVSLEFRYRENEAVVCICAVISVIYAILVGFTVLYELGSFDKAILAEQDEGKAVFAIYRDALQLPEPASQNIRKLIVGYGTTVVNDEWPQMSDGQPLNRDAANHLNSISDVLDGLHKDQTLSPVQTTMVDELYTLNNSLFDIHQERAAKARMSIIPGMWLVLILGTFFTIGMTTLLGMEFRLHLICVGVTALLLSAVIYLLFVIDNPYRSQFAVQPWTMIATLEFISWQKNDDINAADFHKIENKNAEDFSKKHFIIP
jgi:hypothetical protein